MTTVLPDLAGATALTYRGRLPGVACDPALPPREEPVRLDVAAFVGFAEKGPLDSPTLVADPMQYAAVFGGDLTLAQEEREPVHAQLPYAVRSFFDNGGRRCYVVRVAGPDARPGRWEVPGLQIWQPDGTATAAVVESAWPGSWSIGTTVEAQLLTRALPVLGSYTRRVESQPGSLPLGRQAAATVQPGDLLRLDTASAGIYVRVRDVDAATGTVSTDVEVGFDRADPDAPAMDLLDGLLEAVPVEEARLLRVCLLVGHRSAEESRVLAKHDDLAFGEAAGVAGAASRPSWSGMLQPADTSAAELGRSEFLRQDAATEAALATGIAVPVAMPLAGAAPGPEGSTPTPLQEGDDDLDTFDPVADHTWFLDPELAGDSLFSLVPHADQLTVLSHTPRQLRGIHSLIGIDEVAMIAVPDALNRGWSAAPPPEDPPPPEPTPPDPEDWSDFRCCPGEQSEPEPEAEAPPASPPVDPIAALPLLDPAAAYDDTGLRTVQAALVVLCAALADRVALLSVPRHFDVADTVSWRARLCTESSIADGNSTGMSPLSYASYFHPWISVVVGQAGTRSVLRDIAPDGSAAGVIAARELDRGVWLAPAGVAVRGVVRLAGPQPLTEADQKALFDAHANLFCQRPGRFTTLSAHTLTGDPLLLQLSVRRLLILVRTICLRLGERYTFEINNDRFRQLVRMRFDRILEELVRRGALHAYRVETGGGINTAQDQDDGRFIVILRIAPTSPVEFITVTLVRTGEGLLDVLEG